VDTRFFSPWHHNRNKSISIDQRLLLRTTLEVESPIAKPIGHYILFLSMSAGKQQLPASAGATVTLRVDRDGV
jgi:hypothetical protein